MFREVVLGLGNNSVVSGVVKRYGMQMGAARFVAGASLESAIQVTRDLNRRGIAVTLDHLGEAVKDEGEALAAKDSYLTMLQEIQTSAVNANVSLKLTMMGLALSMDLARANLMAVVKQASDFNNFVRIDMEDSPYTAITIGLFEEVWRAFPGHVGLVLQAYLYRTQEDLSRLSVPPKNFRIVKGAYREPVAVAFPSKPDVDDNYVALVRQSLELGNVTAIATHDEMIIGRVLKYLRQNNIPKEQFEFQMLYGVKLAVLEQLAKEGYRTRVYVPYGQDWYAYYVRRIAERPSNLLFFARALIDR
ncbi:MAG: proline dehydrogenase family protein [Sulfobacillus sp.]